MGLIHYENWDGVSAPSIPAGWSAASALATTTSGPTPISSPNMLTLSNFGGSFFTATYGTPDSNSGNVSVVGTLLLIDPVAPEGDYYTYSLLARGNSSNLSYSSSTFYEVRTTQVSGGSGSLQVLSAVSGTETSIANLTNVSIANNEWYQVTFNLYYTQLSVAVQRLLDGYWLNSSGAWQANAATAISVNDSSITGAGYAGLAMASQSSYLTVYGDDWSFSAYSTLSPPTTTMPAGVLMPKRRPIRGPLFSRVYG